MRSGRFCIIEYLQTTQSQDTADPRLESTPPAEIASSEGLGYREPECLAFRAVLRAEFLDEFTFDQHLAAVHQPCHGGADAVDAGLVALLVCETLNGRRLSHRIGRLQGIGLQLAHEITLQAQANVFRHESHGLPI